MESGVGYFLAIRVFVSAPIRLEASMADRQTRVNKEQRWNKERKERKWQRRGGGIRLELVPRVPSDVSSRRMHVRRRTSDVYNL